MRTESPMRSSTAIKQWKRYCFGLKRKNLQHTYAYIFTISTEIIQFHIVCIYLNVKCPRLEMSQWQVFDDGKDFGG